MPAKQGHCVYFEARGGPGGTPIVHFHGGPGAGIEQALWDCVDPANFMLVQFDQRGCGQSIPAGELRHNTTWDLIADAERIRKHLGIERWIVSGGSWGCALAILYAQRHPNCTRGLMLRGVFLGEAGEIDWIGRRTRMIRPEAWAKLAAELGMKADENCYEAMNAVLGPDRELGTRVAVAFNRYEATCATLEADLNEIERSLDAVSCYTATRIGQHYVTNWFFIDEGQCLRDLYMIHHLPCIIVSGRYDLVCPADTAYRLHCAWPRSEWFVASLAGHSSSEPEIRAALRRAYPRLIGPWPDLEVDQARASS